VAYFEFDSETSINFEPDCQRACRYIFLKPTSFRKKLSQKFNLAPLEIEFFGATGTSQPLSDVYSASSLAEGTTSLGSNPAMVSKYDLELRVLNDHGKVLKSLRGLEIQ